MNKTIMMAMLNSRQRGHTGRRVGVEYEDWGPRSVMPTGERGRMTPYRDEPESRFRDRSGREHYNNGRFAPESDGGGYWVESRFGAPERYESGDPMNRYPGRDSPRGWYDPYRHGEMPMIGFSGGDGFRNDHGMDASYRPQDEMSYRYGMAAPGYSKGGEIAPMDRQRAEQWAAQMQNADGTTGPHWSMDQTEQVRAQQNIDCDPIKFWITINMMYSDYCKVAEKLGTSTAEFYAGMARAFLDDKDAQPDKLARYYEYIVRH